jgi:hypothetical protein
MPGTDDPRSKLDAAASAAGAAAAASALYGCGQCLRLLRSTSFHELPPLESGAGRTWYARGQNFVMSYTEAVPGTVLV